MPADQERILRELSDKITRAREQKIRYEERLQQLSSERERILAELQELDVSPEGLEAEMARLAAEVELLLKEAEAMLPPDLPGT